MIDDDDIYIPPKETKPPIKGWFKYWIPVTDHLPEPGTSCIVTATLKSGQKVVKTAKWCGRFGWSGNGNFNDVTAWIKLPEPYEG